MFQRLVVGVNMYQNAARALNLHTGHDAGRSAARGAQEALKAHRSDAAVTHPKHAWCRDMTTLEVTLR